MRLLGETMPSGRRAVIYARISSAKQAGSGNLERQRQRLEEYCRSRGYEIVAVIAEQGSGLNEKRKDLARLFRMAREGKMDLVVIEFKDRLARFGCTYIERFFNAFGVRIEVVNGRAEIPSRRTGAGHALHTHRIFRQTLWFPEQGIPQESKGGHGGCGKR